MQIETKIRLICLPNDGEDFKTLLKQAKTLVKDGVEVAMDWRDVLIPIKKRSTFLGCFNYFVAKSPECPRKHTTHTVPC